ncbi:zinc finger protein 518A isoform X2 [Delphinus delphis]|uniref:zinc finger protein 518A isoform X2 n=1 Tax=Pseudorca crassidens TaxID=82174 RepID=UPI00352F68AD
MTSLVKGNSMNKAGASNPQLCLVSGPSSKPWIHSLPIPQPEPSVTPKGFTQASSQALTSLTRRLAIGSPLCTRDGSCLKYPKDGVLIVNWVNSSMK